VAIFVTFFVLYNWKVDSIANYLFAGTIYIVFQSASVKGRVLSQCQAFRTLETPACVLLWKTDLAS